MLNIVCLNAGNYQARGADYVNRLHDMVRRNLAEGFPGRFICFTDDSDTAAYDAGIVIRRLPAAGLKGWWNKLALFAPGLFEPGDRVLYFDLDTVIAGRLDEIAAYDGPFAILRDFLRPEGWQSSVMAWPAGFGAQIFERYLSAGRPDVAGGDQAWIECNVADADLWQELLPGRFVSYKQSDGAVPDKASVVVFHSAPRPHQVSAGWVPQVWKIGGLSRAELDVVCNTANERLLANIVHASFRDLRWFDFAPDHEGAVCIVGGGPSLAESLPALRAMRRFGHAIWALNGAYGWLIAEGLEPDAAVVLDARPECAAFVAPPRAGVTYLVASQCDAAVFNALPEQDVVLFHNQTPRAAELLARIAPQEKPVHLFGGGTTVGMKALALARRRGFRSFHLYGMDSSYRGAAGHAYAQPLNDGEPVLDVICGGRSFRAAPWMVTQVGDFQALARAFIEEGCTISVAGDGLLAEVARQMAVAPPIVEGRFQEVGGFLWPLADRYAAHAILAEVESAARVIARCHGRSLAVQAGGNVGVFAKRLAEHFSRVVTFEPDAENYECLARNLENEMRIDTLNAGLGDGARPLTALRRSPDNIGAHAVAADAATAGGEAGETVALVALDALELPACDLIWLDVEGYELFALKGAERTIGRFGPVIVVEEKGLGEAYGVSRDAVGRWLAARGYEAADRFGRDVLFVKRGTGSVSAAETTAA